MKKSNKKTQEKASFLTVRKGFLSLFFCFCLILTPGLSKKQEGIVKKSASLTLVSSQTLKLSNGFGTFSDDAILEKNRRRKVFQDYLNAAREIATKTQDDEAKRIIWFFEEGALLSKPVEKGAMVLEGVRSGFWFFVVPLQRSDFGISSIWDGLLLKSKNVGGIFNPASKCLVLFESEISSAWKGIILLHEGRHVGEYLIFSYDYQDQEVFVTKEVRTHQFQNRIVMKLGGKSYRKALNSELRRIQNIHQALGRGPLEITVSMGAYNQELDLVPDFGKPLSDYELDLRQTNLWIHAYFEIYDQFPKALALKLKKRFLFRNYKEKKILR